VILYQPTTVAIGIAVDCKCLVQLRHAKLMYQAFNYIPGGVNYKV
jgi:hypothetical protein